MQNERSSAAPPAVTDVGGVSSYRWLVTPWRRWIENARGAGWQQVGHGRCRWQESRAGWLPGSHKCRRLPGVAGSRTPGEPGGSRSGMEGVDGRRAGLDGSPAATSVGDSLASLDREHPGSRVAAGRAWKVSMAGEQGWMAPRQPQVSATRRRLWVESARGAGWQQDVRARQGLDQTSMRPHSAPFVSCM